MFRCAKMAKPFKPNTTMGLLRSVALAAVIAPLPAAAQQPPQQSSDWGKLPRMQLERQFAGPLQDTIIQRWRDPVDGMICYVYSTGREANTRCNFREGIACQFMAG